MNKNTEQCNTRKQQAKHQLNSSMHYTPSIVHGQSNKGDAADYTEYIIIWDKLCLMPENVESPLNKELTVESEAVQRKVIV